MNDIQPEVLLHLLCFQAAELSEELDTTAALKKALERSATSPKIGCKNLSKQKPVANTKPGASTISMLF